MLAEVIANGFLPGTRSTSATHPSFALLASDSKKQVMPPSAASDIKVMEGALSSTTLPIRASRMRTFTSERSAGTSEVITKSCARWSVVLNFVNRMRIFIFGSAGRNFTVDC